MRFTRGFSLYLNYFKYSVMGAALFAAGTAQAQLAVVNPAVPNPGDFTFGTIADPASNSITFQTFHADNVTLALEPLSPDGLAQRFPSLEARYPAIDQATGLYSNTGFLHYISAANVLGVAITAQDVTFSPASPSAFHAFGLLVPCLATSTDTPVTFSDTSNGLQDYGSSYTQLEWRGATYAQAFQHYLNFLDGGEDSTLNSSIHVNGAYVQTSAPITGQQFRSGIYGCSVANGYRNPLVGSPTSQQFQLVTDGLDLAATDIGTPNDQGRLEDANWGIGVWGGPLGNQSQNGLEMGGRITKSWRAFEGGRSLISLDMPFSYQKLGGRETWKGALAASMTWLVNRRWSLQPRLAWGYTDAPDDKFKGQVVAATLASRFYVPHLWRGALTVGNMVGYSKVLGVRFMDRKVDNGGTENWTLMNGIAYDLPIKTRLGERALAVRTSYAFVHMFGDDLYVRDVHQVSASLGVHLREATVRNRANLLRVGFTGKFASHYHAVSAFAGYQF